jgi:hypothetical protein
MANVVTRERLTASAADLAADYRARGIERQASYGQFVKDRNLRPEISAREFYAIFDAVTPSLFVEHQIVGDTTPTHILTYTDGRTRDIQLVEANGSFVRWISDNGSGSDPNFLVSGLEKIT